MFKWTGSKGLRRASPTGQTGRVHGTMALRGSDIDLGRRRRPAFLPEDPETQGQDSGGPRLQGLEKRL